MKLNSLESKNIVRLKFFLKKCSEIQKKWQGIFSWGLHKIPYFHLSFICIILNVVYPQILFFVYFIIYINEKICSRISGNNN